MLNRITRAIYLEEDDHILDYMEDDGDMVEPKYYIPIIPMVLVNGSEGIGTGWSTSIPSYNPRDIVENLRRKLNGEDFVDMMPWYKGFTGRIEVVDDKVKTYGTFDINEESGWLDITELPIKNWTKDFKKMLMKKMEDSEGKQKEKYPIDDVKEYHTTRNVHFRLEMDDGTLEKLREDEDKLIDYYKLHNNISLNNLVLFND